MRTMLCGAISKVTNNVIKEQAKNIDQLLMKNGAVIHAMIRSVEPINMICYSLENFWSNKIKEYVADFGNGKTNKQTNKQTFKK